MPLLSVYRIFLTILLPGCLCFQALAQKGFHVRVFNIENGLPSNGLKGMQWDAGSGFLWMATEAGVVRFNGLSLKIYSHENMPGIQSERMLFLKRNFAGEILTSDQKGNIFRVNRNQLTFLQKQPLKPDSAFIIFSSLLISPNLLKGRAAPSNTAGLTPALDKIVLLSDTSCFFLHAGRLYFFSRQEPNPGLLPLNDQLLISVFQCGKRVFVVEKGGKVYPIDLQKLQVSGPPLPVMENDQVLPGKDLRYFWENGMDFPILANGPLAWKLTDMGDRLAATLVCNEAPANTLIRFMQYSEAMKTLFIGTESKGLLVVSENRLLPMKSSNTGIDKRNSYYAQVELPQSAVLTNEGTVIGPLPASLPVRGKFNFSTYITRDSTLWYARSGPAASYSYLHNYRYATGKTNGFPGIRCSDNFAIAETEGRLYLADARGIGLLGKDTVEYLIRYPRVDANGNAAFNMLEFEPGILILAACNALIRFDTRSRKADTIFAGNGACIRALWRYGQWLFFGTYGRGYYQYHKGVVKAMPLDRQKFLLHTNCLIGDRFGYCWISTNRGLFKARIDEMLGVFDHPAQRLYYHYFGKNDGMDMIEMNGGCAPCALQMKSGIISFPTMDGLLWVNPEKAQPVLPEGDVYIDEVRVDNRRMDSTALAAGLPAATQEIIIKPGFSAWCNKENINLEYQLNDTLNWKAVDLEDEPLIRLGNLPSGDYVLRIRKLNGFGKNNFSYNEVRFTIITPWYRRWWWYVLLALASGALLMLFLHIRTRQYAINQRRLEKQVAEKTKELQQKNEVLEKNDSIKTRLISIISHDIITPLKFVNAAGKNLIEKRELMSEDLQLETIREIANTSQELQLLSTNILNWIKYQNENRRHAMEQFHPHGLVDQVYGVLNSMARQKQIELINAVDPGLKLYQYFESLKILIYNLVLNAIHFTDRGTVTTGSSQAPAETTIWVKDQGMGMTPEQVQNILADRVIISSANQDNRKGNGLGYLIIKDLLKYMNATISIQSEKGKGTTVFIHVPQNHAS